MTADSPSVRGRPSPFARLTGPRGRRDAAGQYGDVWDHIARVVQRVADRMTPLTSAVSTLGVVVLVGGLVSAYLGLTRGWSELTALAVVCLLVFVFAVLWTLRPATARSVLELSSNRVQIGEQAFGRIVSSARDRRSPLPIRAELPVGKGVAGFTIPALRHEAVHEELFRIPTSRRGRLVIGPVRAVRSDPFELARREKQLSDPVELYVHPRTIALSSGQAGILRDLEGVTTHDLSSSDVSFHALRDYAPGDDRRAIHWRTTARVGHLVVRQFEETRRAHLLVVLSLRPQDYAGSDDFETAVSAAASLGVQARREEHDVTIITHAGLMTAPTGATLLDQLSGVALQQDRRDIADLTAHALTLVAGASVAALITGAQVDASTIRRARHKVPLDVATFALRCDGTLPARRRRLSDLVVLDIPALDALPRAVASLR